MQDTPYHPTMSAMPKVELPWQDSSKTSEIITEPGNSNEYDSCLSRRGPVKSCNAERMQPGPLLSFSTNTCCSSWQAGTDKHMKSNMTEGHDRMASELKQKRADVTAGVK